MAQPSARLVRLFTPNTLRILDVDTLIDAIFASPLPNRSRRTQCLGAFFSTGHGERSERAASEAIGSSAPFCTYGSLPVRMHSWCPERRGDSRSWWCRCDDSELRSVPANVVTAGLPPVRVARCVFKLHPAWRQRRCCHRCAGTRVVRCFPTYLSACNVPIIPSAVRLCHALPPVRQHTQPLFGRFRCRHRYTACNRFGSG
mmetsp:Transcript_47141/g.78043  ORF Transcript_47141/g.78043 Transcript_47141/m.78043 type:complete len:201 (-) Transcript_47141:477-1079(-)